VRNNRNLSEVKRLQIAKRRAAGEGSRRLADEFGITPRHVLRLCEIYEKPPERPETVRHETWAQKVKRLRAKGQLTEFIFRIPA
jgi:hypothetical protein